MIHKELFGDDGSVVEMIRPSTDLWPFFVEMRISANNSLFLVKNCRPPDENWRLPQKVRRPPLID